MIPFQQGVFQGDILSPMIFLFVFNPLLLLADSWINYVATLFNYQCLICDSLHLLVLLYTLNGLRYEEVDLWTGNLVGGGQPLLRNLHQKLLIQLPIQWRPMPMTLPRVHNNNNVLLTLPWFQPTHSSLLQEIDKKAADLDLTQSAFHFLLMALSIYHREFHYWVGPQNWLLKAPKNWCICQLPNLLHTRKLFWLV